MTEYRIEQDSMGEMKVPVNDFYSLLVNKLEFARGDQFHWKGDAYQLLAKMATDSILRELGVAAVEPTAGSVSQAASTSVPWIA